MTAIASDRARDRNFGTNGRGHGSPSNGIASSNASTLEEELRARIAGEVRFDPISRMLYSTDASNYQIEPVGVVVPATHEDVLATIEIASRHRVPLLPRGGGSSTISSNPRTHAGTWPRPWNTCATSGSCGRRRSTA